MPVEPDSTGLADIKDIYEQPFNPGYYKKYIPHVLGAILLIAALILWLRQRHSKRVAPEPSPVPLLPHEWAIKALDELAEKKLWQQGEVKEHYTYLTTILREYLERRFAIHAMEQTSDEILIQLRILHLSGGLLIGYGRITFGCRPDQICKGRSGQGYACCNYRARPRLCKGDHS